jgi:hypothetical protein
MRSMRRAMDRRERDEHLHRRAVRVGDDAVLLVAGDRVRIDLGDDQRNVVAIAELRGVVDDDRAGLRRARRVLARDRRAGGEERDVDAVEIVIGEILHRDLAVAERHLAARRALARQRHEFADREIAFLEDRQHHLADRAGRADHRHVVGLVLVHCFSRFVNVERNRAACRRARWARQ